MSIKYILLEEHHQALFVWLKLRKLIDGVDTVLHVDRHSDLDLPSASALQAINVDCGVQEIQLVQDSFTIDSFLLGAVGHGLYSSVFWLHTENDAELYDQMRFLGTDKCQSANLLTGIETRTSRARCLDEHYRTFLFQASRTLERFPRGNDYVLDIDLDYFGCYLRALPVYTRIEIPQETYQQVAHNSAHWISSLMGSVVEVVEEDDRLYLTFHQGNDEMRVAYESSLDQVLGNVRTFCRMLASLKWAPSLITVTRSVYSGYTPNDWADAMQNELQGELSKLYDLEVLHLEEIK